MSVVGKTQLSNRNFFLSCHTEEKIRSNLLKRKIPDVFLLPAQAAVQAYGGGSWWGKSFVRGGPREERWFFADAQTSI